MPKNKQNPIFNWFLRESTDNWSLVWLSPGISGKKNSVLAQASGPPTVSFAKAGLEHSETTKKALKYYTNFFIPVDFH